MVRSAVLVLLLGTVAVVAQPTTPPQKPTAEKKTVAPPDPLDDLIAQALRNNPDIRVAEAKVREAEAELQRIRVATAQKVAALHQAIESARESRDTARQLHETVARLADTGQAPHADLLKAQAASRLAVAEIAKLEAEMPGLLGKMPGRLGQQKAESSTESRADVAVARGLRWLALQQELGSGETGSSVARLLAAAALSEVKAGPEGTIAERMRKALDKSIEIKSENMSLKDVLEHISDLAENGITFRIAPTQGEGVINGTQLVSLQFSKIPVGAVLQALNDHLPDLAFVVRDYGILVCAAKNLPPDAVLLHRFWKSGTADSNAKNPPASGRIEGEVTEVDEKSGLVRIETNGSDLGLAKGHTLEVYRTNPKPVYIGTIRILDVAPGIAVGRPGGKRQETIKKGDKVTSRLTDR
jgi:hypothetical protein